VETGVFRTANPIPQRPETFLIKRQATNVHGSS
jgi:hypothetical protein